MIYRNKINTEEKRKCKKELEEQLDTGRSGRNTKEGNKRTGVNVRTLTREYVIRMSRREFEGKTNIR